MNGVWDNDRLIRVDMTNLTVAIEDYPAEWKYLGGRALSARILLMSAILPVILLVRTTSWCWRRASFQEHPRPLPGVCQSAVKARLPAVSRKPIPVENPART